MSYRITGEEKGPAVLQTVAGILEEGASHALLFVLTEEGGATAEVTVFVDEKAGLIFADDFESGTTGSWDSATP